MPLAPEWGVRGNFFSGAPPPGQCGSLSGGAARHLSMMGYIMGCTCFKGTFCLILSIDPQNFFQTKKGSKKFNNEYNAHLTARRDTSSICSMFLMHCNQILHRNPAYVYAIYGR